MNKACIKCGKLPTEVHFYPHTRGKPGFMSTCAACTKEKAKEWKSKNVSLIKRQDKDRYARNREKSLNCSRDSRYGLPHGWYDNQLAKQGGVCAICGGTSRHRLTKKLAVDHCHTTGVVRGLLCPHCNHALGMLGDDPVKAERAAQYLRASTDGNPVVPFHKAAVLNERR